MKETSSQFQEWLIAIALAIVIPTTVYLGVVVVAPKVNFNQYYKVHNEFFKDYSRKDVEKYKQREKEWSQTQVFVDHEANKCEKKGLMLIVSGIVSIALFFLGSVFTLPVISFGLLLAGIDVFALNFFMYAPCNSYYGISLLFLEMLFSLIGLLIVLWFAYQSSEKNKVTNNGR